jgi:electron transfer flavoprotein beta subunit
MKQVPLKLKTGADGLMDRSGASQINPYCAHALEEAIKHKIHFKNQEAKITVFSMGPPNFEKSLRKAISMGADDAVLLSDRKLAGSDTMATAKALSRLIEVHEPASYDILYAGLQTIDGDTAHVGPQVAERLGYNQATYVTNVEFMDGGVKIRRLIEKGFQHLFIPYPAMLSVTNTANTPRGPYLKGAMLAKQAQIKIYSVDDLGFKKDDVGAKGSPTVVAKVKNVKSSRELQKYEGSAKEQVESFLKAVKKLGNGEQTAE